MKRIVLLILAMVIAFTPATAFAENGELEKGFVLRIDGDLHLGAGESLESAVVINGRAVIDGEVEETLVVISGSAVISGRVGDDVVLIDSDLELTESGLVGDDVILIDGDISRAVGSVVGGEVRDEFDFSI